jgi:hypothetical protein
MLTHALKIVARMLMAVGNLGSNWDTRTRQRMGATFKPMLPQAIIKVVITAISTEASHIILGGRVVILKVCG